MRRRNNGGIVMKINRFYREERFSPRKVAGKILCLLTFLSLFSSTSAIDYAIICGLDIIYISYYRQYLVDALHLGNYGGQMD